MRTSTKRILSILFSGIFFIGAIYMFTGPVQEEMKTINKKRAEVATKKSLNSKNTQVFEQAKKLMAELQNIKGSNTIALAIPDGEQAVSALRQIESIGKSANVKFKTINFKSITPRSSLQPDLKKLSVLEVEVSVVGGYLNLKDFLKKIESSVRVANVKTMSYKPGTDTKVGEDAVDVTIEMYYQN
jgi:Tfp pilus assembly protein PilO